MSSVTQVTQELGNTKTSSKKNRRLRKACFTLNNWTESELTQILTYFADMKYIIGKEIGESKTPHLQGYVEFGRQYSFKQIKEMIPRAHIEKPKGTREQNIKYCSKEGNVVSTFPLDLDQQILQEYAEIKWRPWQEMVIDIVEGETSPRSVHWFWEETGNVGKSFLTKYLYLKYGAIIGTGKKADIFNQIATWMAEKHNKNKSPELILLDIPRTNIKFICFDAIEQIKNGFFHSGKYEGKNCVYKYPKIIIFANSKPDTSKMSKDRWEVFYIGEGEEPAEAVPTYCRDW